MNKEELRKNIKEKRNHLSKQEVTQKSQIIASKLFKLLKNNNNDTFFIYKSFNNEVETNGIITALLKENKIIYLPKTVNDTLIAIKYTSKTPLIKGKYSIEEPQGKEENINNFICIAPLLAIDKHGNRIGFGKGYYDSFLKEKNCLKIGLCYDFQIVGSIKKESHDIPLDIIISEKRIIICNNKPYVN